jgi:hypothetical protein
MSMEIQKSLLGLVGWIEHGIPKPPNHGGSCGPESQCDTECMIFAHYCRDLERAKTLCASTESQSSLQKKVDDITAVLKEWDSKEGHERCWYYPDLFKKIAEILNFQLTKEPILPTRAEFEQGCRKYQGEQFCPKG